jgi:hypothetical protein
MVTVEGVLDGPVQRFGVGSSEVPALRQTLWHARRFGDALAWVLLHGDRSIILPLAENQRVPVPPDDERWQGVLALAFSMAKAGYGFPLLHDMTDILRIGDIPFVRPGKPPRPSQFVTVAVRVEDPLRGADDRG